MKEFVELLLEKNVDFVVVGAYALAFHGHPRYTQDIDLFVRRTKLNAAKIIDVIDEFGFGSLKLVQSDFTNPDHVIQLGMSPNRIDILTNLTGVSFASVWKSRIMGKLGNLEVAFISIDEFVANKLACGRPKDLADVHELTAEGE